jgi:hypothetical protein
VFCYIFNRGVGRVWSLSVSNPIFSFLSIFFPTTLFKLKQKTEKIFRSQLDEFCKSRRPPGRGQRDRRRARTRGWNGTKAGSETGFRSSSDSRVGRWGCQSRNLVGSCRSWAKTSLGRRTGFGDSGSVSVKEQKEEGGGWWRSLLKPKKIVQYWFFGFLTFCVSNLSIPLQFQFFIILSLYFILPLLINYFASLMGFLCSLSYSDLF